MCGALILLSLTAAPAHADELPLRKLWQSIHQRVEAARPLVPPTPTPVRWRQRRAGSVDLGAPLLALIAADVDGDGRAELVALTSRELVALRPAARRADVVARAELPGEPPAVRPRAPVGTLVAAPGDGGPIVLRARTTERATAATFRFSDGALVAVPDDAAAFPLCGHAAAALYPGRNTFDAVSFVWLGAQPAPQPPERFWTAACRDDLVDPLGARTQLFAVVGDDGNLRLDRWGPAGRTQLQIDDVGAAFALADVDTDGHVDVIASAATAPGRGDRVSVYEWVGDELQRAYRTRSFAGGVVGIATGDVDGDGATDVIAAVRLPNATQIDLWLLTSR